MMSHALFPTNLPLDKTRNQTANGQMGHRWSHGMPWPLARLLHSWSPQKHHQLNSDSSWKYRFPHLVKVTSVPQTYPPLSVQKPMVAWVESRYMLALGFPVNLSMRSPQAIIPSFIPLPADRINIWFQPAGMFCTVAWCRNKKMLILFIKWSLSFLDQRSTLIPAPKNARDSMIPWVNPEAIWCAIGWLSGENTVMGSSGSELLYITRGTPPWCDSA